MMKLKRRSFFASLSLTVPALMSGCLSDGTDRYETEGNDDDLIEVDAVELAIESHQIEGDGWEIVREEDYGVSFTRHFSRGEGHIGNSIDVYESVDEAKESLEWEKEALERQDLLWGEHKIGSEGYFFENLGPTVVVRDANVVGSVISLSGEDEDLVFSTAVEMHEAWR